MSGRIVGIDLGTSNTVVCAVVDGEAIVIPEELRGKIPDDYGRSRGIAWYYLGAFKITHANTTNAESKKQARIIKWASAA